MLLHDLVAATRNLARRPGFLLGAILLLALGAGANAAVVAMVRGVLLRPLPFASPDRLVAIWPDGFVSNDDVGFWRERAHSFSSVASLAPGWLMAMAAEGGEPLEVTGARVSDNLFTVVGTRAALGRAIAPGDGAPGPGCSGSFDSRAEPTRRAGGACLPRSCRHRWPSRWCSASVRGSCSGPSGTCSRSTPASNPRACPA